MANPYSASTDRIDTTLKFRLIIDSHNFGRIGGGDIGHAVISFTCSKQISGPGSLSLQLAPICEWRDIISADDYVNFYVNTGVGEEDTIYNRGWVRLFFGFVNDISATETTGADGTITIRYSLSATDFYKALERTTIYNHPAIPATEIFGANIAGVADALYRLGLVEQGSPRFLVMNILHALLGYGKQWVLPPHYEDEITSPPSGQIEYRSEDVTATLTGGVKNRFAKERLRNDVLKDIQTKRSDMVKYIAFRSTVQQEFISTEKTKKDRNLKNSPKNEKAKKTEEKQTETSGTQYVWLDPAGFSFRQVVSNAGAIYPKNNAVQLTPDVLQEKQEARSLLDVLCFDYLECVEGYYADFTLYAYSGPILQLLYSVIHPILNEFFFDLRPTMDFLVGGFDGIKQDVEDGVVMVPSVVLREMPFTYLDPIKCPNPRNVANRLIDVSKIRDEEKDYFMRSKSEQELYAQRVRDDKELRKLLDKIKADSPTEIQFLDPASSVWTQKDRVVDYGDVLGFNFDSFWEEPLAAGDDTKKPLRESDYLPGIASLIESGNEMLRVSETMSGTSSSVTRYKNIIRYQRGPRTLEHIEIRTSDVISCTLGRGDQDLITGYDCVPTLLMAEVDSRAFVRDYTPQFRMLLIRRHGLQFVEHKSYYTATIDPYAFAFVDRYSPTNANEGYSIKVSDSELYSYNKKYIELGVGDKKITADKIFNSVEWYMNIKVTILRDMWDQHNLEYLSGSINLRGFPGIRVGYRLDWPEKDLSFYVTGVSHGGTFGGPMSTSVTVTRGQPMESPLPNYLPDNRKKGEMSDCFKLGQNFPLANPSYGVYRATGQRVNIPGEYKPGDPSDMINSNVWQNWFRNGINILCPNGINVNPLRTETSLKSTKENEFLIPERSEERSRT